MFLAFIVSEVQKLMEGIKLNMLQTTKKTLILHLILSASFHLKLDCVFDTLFLINDV